MVQTRIEIDRSEAEKYEFTCESCIIFISFYQPNIVIII